ncbi:MAG TPA: element excision factor XisI family protein [Saprospiraceae bacterium]|nr:element excision factor XisI family protein [Saprospiraceae bacterium]HMQ84444.1 element excision factor XisI family protein [Saprospiraceae bacterium]
MEKVALYRSIAKLIIAALGQKKGVSKHKIRYQTIFDEQNGNYILLRNGWKGSIRFYNIIVHIEVDENGLVWLHQDNTDLIIADLLMEKGIPRDHIVLAFHPPIARPDTTFATGG